MDGHWPSRKSTNYFSDTSSKASTAVLEGLEKVADYCDKLDIALVKINDLELVILFVRFSIALGPFRSQNTTWESFQHWFTIGTLFRYCTKDH